MSLADPPRLAPRDIVSSGLCIGCGSCAAGGRDQGAGMGWDDYGQLKPNGPGNWYGRPSAAFAATCPFSPHARDEDQIAAELFPGARHQDGRIGRFESAYVGHVEEEGFRTEGSSGGLVSWVAAELMRQGHVDAVAHVGAADPDRDGRYFAYRVSRSEAEVRSGAKSRYYPIELSSVLDEIRNVPGRYAVVGIPCFIKAVHLARAADPILAERITFTLGLYCGHMKSARMIDSFALQMGADPGRVRAVNFRVKNADRPANWYRSQLQLADGQAVEQDWWHLVEGDWGSGFFQNSACNFCDDVVAETADISFGDAWVEPYSSDPWGTNVAVVRSLLLERMIDEGRGQGRLALKPVDADFIADTQAAGFRQRREGLAYRLARRRHGIMPRKRVTPGAGPLPVRRRAVYRMREAISRWSHLLFRLADRVGTPGLYFGAGRGLLALYQGLIYSRGRAGAVFDRIERLLTRQNR